METLLAIIVILLLSINIPTTVALFLGIKTSTTSTCVEDIKSVKHNRIMLKCVSAINALLSIVLFVMSICGLG